MIHEKPVTPGADNSGSRDYPETPVSQMGTKETGRGARKYPCPEVSKATNMTKPTEKYCSNQKTDFRP